MSKKVLTPAAAMEIKRLRALVDVRGNCVYSQMKIASMLGVSETTVFRVLNKGGAYMALPEMEDIDEAAKASELKFKLEHPELFEDSALEKMKAAVHQVVEAPAKTDAMLEELRTVPRSPLDEE